MKAQDPNGPMKWTIFRTGPYVESLSEALRPRFNPDGTAVFALPLGEEGQMPFVGLEDLAHYVDWALSHPDEAKGQDIGIAIEHAGLKKLAAAYTAVTGKPAAYQAISAEDWNKAAWAKLPRGGATKVGFTSIKDDNALYLTYEQNFTNWFNLYRANTVNDGLLQRDFALLDKILPSRDRSVEGWMRRVGYTGERKVVLKSVQITE